MSKSQYRSCEANRSGRSLVAGLSASGSFNSILELARAQVIGEPTLKGCVKPMNRSLNVQAVKLTAINSLIKRSFSFPLRNQLYIHASRYINRCTPTKIYDAHKLVSLYSRSVLVSYEEIYIFEIMFRLIVQLFCITYLYFYIYIFKVFIFIFIFN